MTEQEAIKQFKERLSIEDCRKAIPEYYAAMEMAVSALEEIQQYRKLGTVEELRDAREKQMAKNPLFGADAVGHEYARCRECSAILEDGEWIAKYCPDCGQAIDWSGEEAGRND